jgi:Leucine-rich repeat (LRR) protein
MQPLNEDLSRELLMKNVFGSPNKCPHDLRGAADNILKKCGGLPLAIVSIAQHLRSMLGRLTEDKMDEVCTHLGEFLENNPTLGRMKQALIRTYDSLPGHDLKNCLLSVSIFPKGYPIKKKSLVRRWLAEGLVEKPNVVGRGEENWADKYFDELMDRNVIQPEPVDGGSNTATAKKSCHIHGVMLDFIVHKSVSEKFVTVVHKDTDNRRTNREVARRLSLQNSNNSNSGEEEEEAAAAALRGRTAMEIIDLSRVRSLAIFKHDGKDLLKFQTCKLLRALDLEECKGIKDGILDSICELLHLKYLSLRGTRVSKLPKKVGKLKTLETLDIRETGVEVLPKQVLMLPKLLHLLGKFCLPSELKSRKKKHQFSAEQSLQTLAGFVVNKQSPGFEHISHMKGLRKVKVWCGVAPPAAVSSAAPEPKIQLSQSIKSLSVDFGDRPISFLYNIDTQTPCSCESIKLKGKLLNKLPDFMLYLHTLLELRLVSFDLHGGALAELGRLHRLRYLKLSDSHSSNFSMSSFRIHSDSFPSLEHMCFETPRLPQVSIKKGAMPKLTYLQLLCKDVNGFDVKDIAKLGNLKEVTLDESVPPKSMKAWEEAAKVHIKSPTVKTCKQL